MAAETYDPKDITASVDGNKISGFAEQMITAERESDQVVDEAGAQGDVTRVITNDRRGNITITLLPTSPSNLLLSERVNGDAANGVDRRFSILIKDQRGKDLVSASDCWIRKPPRMVWNKGVEAREWAIRAADLHITAGGVA